MKLSESMRKGAALRPKVENAVFLYNAGTDTCIGSCALGAAYEGHTGAPLGNESEVLHALCDVWPELNTVVQMPVGTGTAPIRNVVAQLNDNYGWTREQIAAWVESLGQ